MKMLTILMILICSSLAFANITPTTIEPVTMYGGETKEYIFTITNDFSYDCNVDLNFILSNNSGNLDGMAYNIYPSNNFSIKAYEQQTIKIELKTQPNIYPEEYNFSLNATYYLSDTQTPIRIEKVYSRGKASYVYTPIYKDKNIQVVKEVPKEVIKEIETIREVPGQTVYVDKNIIQTIVNNDATNIWAGLAIGLFLITLGLISFIFISSKNGVNGKEV